jgi:hypothetical protein
MKIFFLNKGRVQSTLIFITHRHCTNTNIVPAGSNLLIATEIGHDNDVWVGLLQEQRGETHLDEDLMPLTNMYLIVNGIFISIDVQRSKN